MRALLADGFVIEVISACASKDEDGKFILCLERPGGDEFLFEYKGISIKEAEYRTSVLIGELFKIGYADFSKEPMNILPKESGEKEEKAEKSVDKTEINE